MREMSQELAKHLLTRVGAIIEGHFVGTNGNHLSVYIAKDKATRFPSVVSELCLEIAERFASFDIDVVVAPAVGGIALSQWTAHHLAHLRPDRQEVLALYSEHDDSVFQREMGIFDENSGRSIPILLQYGEQIILRQRRFVFKRGFGEDIAGRRVLVVEDVLTTGKSTLETVMAIKREDGIVVGLGVLANGGNVTPEACGVKRLESLVSVVRQIFTEEECADHGFCSSGVPINTDFGHGKAFLERKKKLV